MEAERIWQHWECSAFIARFLLFRGQYGFALVYSWLQTLLGNSSKQISKRKEIYKYIYIDIVCLLFFFFIIWAWYDMISQLNHKLKYVVWHFTSKSWKSKRPVTRRRTTVMNSTTTIPLSKKPIWNDWQCFGENYECLISGACDPWNIHEQCSIKTKLRKIHTVFLLLTNLTLWKSFKKLQHNFPCSGVCVCVN